MSHERSVTVNVDGKYVNLSTDGGKITPGQAVEQYTRGERKPLGGRTYDDKDKAVDAAKRRSRQFGNRHKN